MTDKEIIEVVAASAAGKQIQSQLIGHECDDWLPLRKGEKIYWNFIGVRYRVAPEPTYLISGYCFPKDLHPTPSVGMIKVQQVELEKGENPLPRKSREWKCFVSVDGKLVESVDVQATRDRQWLCRPIKVREVIE